MPRAVGTARLVPRPLAPLTTALGVLLKVIESNRAFKETVVEVFGSGDGVGGGGRSRDSASTGGATSSPSCPQIPRRGPALGDRAAAERLAAA